MKAFRTFLSDFCICGITGWCMEILFTAIYSFRNRDLKGKGNTSVWMFPIYGCAALIRPLSILLKGCPVWLRGLTYMTSIFAVEYTSGNLLTKKNLCPWDYGSSKYHVKRVIRIDYAIYWFFAGLLFEKILTNRSNC